MNAFCGIFRLDGGQVDQTVLAACRYISPRWTPDHQDLWISDPIGMITTQRYITPECAHAPMPYHHASGCVLLGDLYLTHREDLEAELGAESHLADAELIMLAYLKWGEDCPKHLCGNFVFAIWNPTAQHLFMATDPMGTNPSFYAYKPGEYFVFSNDMSAMKKWCSPLTLNHHFFQCIALDNVPTEETCYKEVLKINAGMSFLVSQNSLKKRQYWRLKDQKRRLPYKTREEYYSAFRDLFAKTVQSNMRTIGHVSGQISGGLDSSSVAAMAAHLLAQKNQPFFGFTSLPVGLEGEMIDRKGWYYHEMPIVQTLLDQYPNIQHTAYYSPDDVQDIQERLSAFFPQIDIPYRNIFNMDWGMESTENALQNQCRIVLHGGRGNGSISWAGVTRIGLVVSLCRSIKSLLFPSKIGGYYSAHHPELMDSPLAKTLLRQNNWMINPQYWMLTAGGAGFSSARPISLFYGVEQLDPTGDRRILEFCYNLPQWVYRKGRAQAEKRLLVREGLEGILPEKIRRNLNRGEQATDWGRHFNRDYPKWKKFLAGLPEDHRLWQLYHREKILDLFMPVPLKPTREMYMMQNCNLTRCVNTGLFLEKIEAKET